MMKDQYGRIIDYLRVSITDRCNLRCVYCMPEEGVTLVPHKEILTFEEICFICGQAATQGIRHLKVTGGEPLVREGAAELVKRLKQIEGIDTVTMTTNGILLPKYIEKLAEAGIDGINISLDTLNCEKFRQITRNGNVEAVRSGIESVLPYQGITVKINCVLDGVNWEKDACEVAELAKKYPLHVRFIELMPFQKQHGKGSLEREVKQVLEACYGRMTRCNATIGFGPSVYYEMPDFKGKIGFISAVSHKFCNQCNRIRLTCDGILRMCLQSDEGVDLKTPLRENAAKEELGNLIKLGLTKKPKEHQFECDCIQAESMSQIGG